MLSSTAIGNGFKPLHKRMVANRLCKCGCSLIHLLLDVSNLRPRENMERRFGQMTVLLPKIGCASGYFCPEFEQFKHVSFPEFTAFENRELLPRRVLARSMVEMLNIRAAFPRFA